MRFRSLAAASVVAAAAGLLLPAQAAAQVTYTVTASNPSQCVLPQGTIDLFTITVTNSDTTFAATLIDLRVDISGGPTGIDTAAIDSVHVRAQNASNAAGETLVSRPTVGSLTGLRIIFNTDNVVLAGTTRTYILGITMSDTAAFGDAFQVTIPAGNSLRIDTGGGATGVNLGSAVTTPVIEVCGLFADDAVPGANPDDVPFIVGAASGDIPLIGLRLAVPQKAANLGGVGYQLRQVVLRFIDTGETMNFRPGHPNKAPLTEFGDLENIRIWRDANGDGKFDPAVDVRLFTRSRHKLGCGISADDNDPNDVALQTFAFDTQTYRLAWSISQTNPNAIIEPTSIALAQQSSSTRFNHWITFATNDANAYGDLPDPLDGCGAGGFVGHGDEWRAQLESITITERRFPDQFGNPKQRRDLTIRFQTPDDAAQGDTPPRGEAISDTVNEIMANPLLNTLRGDSAPYSTTGGATLDAYFDLSPSGELERTDGADLDWVGQIIGEIWAIGSPTSFSTNEKLHGVNIVFIGGGGFDPTDLRGVSGSTADGIQIWRNVNGNDGLEEGTDIPLPLDPNNSVWVQLNATTWVFRARLKNPDRLNQGTYGQGMNAGGSTFSSDASAGASGSGMRLYSTSSGIHPDYWITAVQSSTADANDSALVFIDDGSIVGEAGVIFTSGNSNRRRGSGPTNAGGVVSGLVVWNVPTIWTDFTTTGQTIQQLSPPTPVLGLDMRDGNANAGGDQRIGLQSMSIYFLDEGTDTQNLSSSDFLAPTFETEAVPGRPNPVSRSGIALYRDNNGHPQNNEGVFDPGIDTLVPLADVDDPAPPDTGTGWHTPGNVRDALRFDLILDSTSVDTQIPNDNAGLNLGPDFFLVLRTSNSISGNDRFRVVIGDLDTNDGIRSYVRVNNHSLPRELFALLGSVADTPNPTVPFRQDIFSPFQSASMRTEQIAVNTLTSATVQNAVPSGFTVDRDERFSAFGINMLDGTANPITLEQVLVDVFDAGGGSFATSDLAAIDGSSPTSGVALFADTGVGTTKGVFDAGDVFVPATITQSVITAPFGGTARRYTITPLRSIQVPDDDTTPANIGNDLHVVLRTSSTIRFADSFYARIPDTGVIFSAASFNANRAETSNLVTANVPTAITDSTVSGETVTPGVRKVIFGIDADDSKTDNTDGNVFLASVDVILEGVTNFQLADIFASLTFPQKGDTTTGLALFKDNGATSGFFDSTDGNLPVQITNLGGPPFEIRLAVTGGDSAVPAGNAGADTGPDFFLVVTVSTTAQNGDQFRVGIQAGDIGYTAGSPKSVSDTSEILTVAGAAGSAQLTPRTVISPDGNGTADTTGIRVSLAFETSYHVRVVRNVTGAQVSPNAFPFQARDDDTTIPVGTGTTLDAPTLVPGFYDVAVDFATTPAGDTQTDTFATQLAVDLLADTPEVTTFSVSGNVVTIAARHRLDDCPQTAGTARDACLANEQAERAVGASTLFVLANGDTVDSFPLPVGNTADGSIKITLPNGTFTLTGVLRDAVGNITKTPFTIRSSFQVGTVDLTVGFEGNSPVFYWTPADQTFTFTFPARTVGAPFLEIYNLAGNRVRRISIPGGVTTVTWDGRNDAGQLMRNGVYLLKFNVPLEGGLGSIEERRTIVLMK